MRSIDSLECGIRKAMIIQIRIASALLGKIPDIDKDLHRDSWEMPEGTDIQQVLALLNLADTPTLLVVNGWQGVRDRVLEDGDTLEIVGVPSGG